ncbi:iron uptake transporter deferrochelatase/peroxidase subunit [Streptomyces sp. NBC_00078]|uniref:iron uptake transporter deferrochelatase/peroxidase subunit n=1 Tax=unclassified Streptomyces TaxID=2593676 RepID=UPI00224F38BE|nr:iron uptake transporter deferrochelatase/peroxidase subunit [Streptomyces sp. NBC_00078]MCX5423627.1 iron uptake transporter deferrochelatase/peroxidase subunit [Streptomyces sp. NBC_00078]
MREDSTHHHEGQRVISRRRLLGTAGAAGTVGLLAGAGGGTVAYAAGHDPTPLTAVGDSAVPFRGIHQAGITTAPQAVGHLIAFDLGADAGRKEAAALMRRWSTAAEAMAQGHPPTGDDQIALDAGPCRLSITFGFGRTFFTRTGLAHRAPGALVPVPRFPSDAIDPKRSEGDLWIQIGADDPLVAFHALRILQREATGTAEVRWQMSGFNRAPGVTAHSKSVRNLMGQLDGTANPKPTDRDFAARIFVPDGHGDEAWLNGGSYAVVRRIRIRLDDWADLSRTEQEQVIGRRKDTGAPLSAPDDAREATPMDLDKFTSHGALAIPADAHIRVAAPESNDQAAMLRRGFSYHDGYDTHGQPDAGLLFIAWQADPAAFVKVQTKLDGADHLTRFIRHESNAVFAVPGGAAPGEYVGQSLLEG